MSRRTGTRLIYRGWKRKQKKQQQHIIIECIYMTP